MSSSEESIEILTHEDWLSSLGTWVFETEWEDRRKSTNKKKLKMSSAGETIEIITHEDWLSPLETRVFETEWEDRRKSTKTKKPKMSSAEETIEIIINNEWLGSLETRVAETKWEGWRTEGPTIFKVPRIFQEADPKAYEPKMVSLGPYHHGKIHLKAMEDLKWHYLKIFLGRNPGKPLEDYIERIKEKELEARMAYSVKVGMTSDEFSQMMLLDCCFVIEILFSCNPREERQEKEEEAVDKGIVPKAQQIKPFNTDEKGTEAELNPITGTRYTLSVVLRDMLMLENQLPFCLLQTLFHSAFPESPDDSLKNWTLSFVSMLVTSKIETPPNIGSEKIHHILHLWHCCIHPSNKRDDREQTNHATPLLKWIPSATELMEAGVHFRKKKEATNFLDITFQNGEMEIPLLQVDDGTETFLRNLIAFEQCSRNVSSHVTAYAALMDCIINTAADVALLQQRRIILSGLGDGKQVADLFNKLCKEVTLDYEKSYVSGIYEDVNEHCATKCNQWRARLNHDYFSHPWAVISVFAAIFLFVLAITQTILSVLSYVRPPN